MLKNHDVTAFNLMTFSIVARDPLSGELGVAVASCWPAVGSLVPWVQPGVGAVATQAATNRALGPGVLGLLRDGVPIVDALDAVLRADPGREQRQVGLVAADGGSAAHTGGQCVAEAAQLCAADVSVQGNVLASAEVPAVMLDAFGRAAGDLAERLLAALRAGEDAGGDARGRQSSALMVTPGSPDAEPWDRRFDLRVDDHAAPVDELARLLLVARAYEALDTVAGDAEVAHSLPPGDPQVAFWHAVTLLVNDRPEEARMALAGVSGEAPRWASYAQRAAEAEPDPALAQAIADVGRLLRGGL